MAILTVPAELQEKDCYIRPLLSFLKYVSLQDHWHHHHDGELKLLSVYCWLSVILHLPGKVLSLSLLRHSKRQWHT